MEIPCCGFTCPVEATLRLVGGKYKAVILWHLMDAGTLRYHELHRRIPRATDKMLAQQLRELERDGLLRGAKKPPTSKWEIGSSVIVVDPRRKVAKSFGRKS